MTELSESTMRSRAIRLGYRINKSRERMTHLNNCGEYMLTEAYHNCVVLGDRFDASLEDIDAYLKKRGAAS